MLSLGETVTIHYPTTTQVGFFDRVQKKPRQIVVRSIRDLVREPLTPEEFLRRPFIRRSRWLVRAFEIEHKRFRQFYLGSSLEFEAPCQLRIALFDPHEPFPKKLLFRPIEPTMQDRKLLARALLKWRDKDFGGLQLGIYSDDLRLRVG